MSSINYYTYAVSRRDSRTVEACIANLVIAWSSYKTSNLILVSSSTAVYIVGTVVDKSSFLRSDQQMIGNTSQK